MSGVRSSQLTCDVLARDVDTLEVRNKVLGAEVRIIAHLVVQVGGGTNRGLSQIQQFGLQLLYRELGDLVRSGDLMAETGCLKRSNSLRFSKPTNNIHTCPLMF